MLASVVDLTLTLAGTVESFNSTQFRWRLADTLATSVDAITLQVSAASIIVVARVAAHDATEAASFVASLMSLTSASNASVVLGVQIESIQAVTSSLVPLLAPSYPPAPTPPSPMQPLARLPSVGVLHPPSATSPAGPLLVGLPPRSSPGQPAFNRFPTVTTEAQNVSVADGVDGTSGLLLAILIPFIASGLLCLLCHARRVRRKNVKRLSQISPETLVDDTSLCKMRYEGSYEAASPATPSSILPNEPRSQSTQTGGRDQSTQTGGEDQPGELMSPPPAASYPQGLDIRAQAPASSSTRSEQSFATPPRKENMIGRFSPHGQPHSFAINGNRRVKLAPISRKASPLPSCSLSVDPVGQLPRRSQLSVDQSCGCSETSAFMHGVTPMEPGTSSVSRDSSPRNWTISRTRLSPPWRRA